MSLFEEAMKKAQAAGASVPSTPDDLSNFLGLSGAAAAGYTALNLERLRNGQEQKYTAVITPQQVTSALSAGMQTRGYTVQLSRQGIIEIRDTNDQHTVLLTVTVEPNQEAALTTIRISPLATDRVQEKAKGFLSTVADKLRRGTNPADLLGSLLSGGLNNIDQLFGQISQTIGDVTVMDLVCVLVDSLGRSAEEIETKRRNQQAMANYEANEAHRNATQCRSCDTPREEGKANCPNCGAPYTN